MTDSKTLHILWTNGDEKTAQFMVMMYATNGMLRGWWNNITVIIWGAPAKLVAENEIIQEQMKAAQHAGVKFSACIACARQLGVIEDLERLGVEVIPWGERLSEILQNDEKLLSI